MDINKLLTCAPVGVRKVRQADSKLEVVDGIIVRTSHVVDYELPQGVWDTLLKTPTFAQSWELVKTGRTARQEAKKQAIAQAEKATLLSHVDLLKSAGLINA